MLGPECLQAGKGTLPGEDKRRRRPGSRNWGRYALTAAPGDCYANWFRHPSTDSG